MRVRLNLPASHVQVARRLRKGEFLAYIGKYAYIVDCFSTSTPDEFQLFKTDDAVMEDREVPGATAEPELTLDDLWPSPEREDVLESWLAASPAQAGGTE